MTRLVSFAAALVASAAALTAAAGPARAAGPGAYYVATPEGRPAKPALVTHSATWTLRDGSYVAARAPERGTVLCQLVARDVGRLSGFSAGGTEFDADALAKCNRRAKADPAAAMAAR